MIELAERVEMMTRNVIMGGIHHDLWSLHLRDTTWDATRAYREGLSELWSATSLAHRYSFYVRLAAAYAEGPKVNSIPQLAREIRPLLERSEQEKLDVLLQEASVTTKKVELLRNNIYAHQSRRRTIKDAYQEADISLDEGAHHVSASIDILNILRRQQGLGECNIGRQHIEEFGRVIEAAQILQAGV